MESISNTLKRVQPALPVAPYLGGKRNLAKRICSKISGIDHQTYVEPFVGMGGVFFRRQYKPKSEVINDLNKDVSNLFRILQRHKQQFIEVLKFQLCTRADFQRLLKTNAEHLTDLERAARFLFLQRVAFGGKITGQSFGVSIGRSARFNLTTLEPMLHDAHERLSSVIIECLPYENCITRYDREETLFYLDPPYYNCENDYGKDMFTKSNFEFMAAQLQTIKGRFILSINDTPEIRAIFKPFEIETVSTTYSISKRTSTKAKELIISN